MNGHASEQKWGWARRATTHGRPDTRAGPTTQGRLPRVNPGPFPDPKLLRTPSALGSPLLAWFRAREQIALREKIAPAQACSGPRRAGKE